MGRDQYPVDGPMLLFQLNMALPNVSTNPNDERIAWGIIRATAPSAPPTSPCRITRRSGTPADSLLAISVATYRRWGPGSGPQRLLLLNTEYPPKSRTVAARYPLLCIFTPYTTLVC